MNPKPCGHANASILASAPVMLLREKGHVIRVIVGDLARHSGVLISCPDCGAEMAFSSDGGRVSPLYKMIKMGNQEKDSLASAITMRTVSQEVKDRLSSIKDPLSLEMLDDLLWLLLSMNADGSVLVDHHAFWCGQLVPIVSVKGRNITAPGNVGLAVTLTCIQCQQVAATFSLISGLAHLGSFIQPKPMKGHYTRVLNKQGYFVFDLERTGYVCDQCKVTAKGKM